jgi:hypothetical protein
MKTKEFEEASCIVSGTYNDEKLRIRNTIKE